MDKDRTEGAVERAKGKVKKNWGKLIGDKETEAEGATEETAGTVQNTVGGVKDQLKK